MAADDRYRLAAVRDARARDERGTQHVLAGAVDDARIADSRLTAARARTSAARTALAAAIHARDALLTGTSAAPVVQRADRFVTRRRHELATAIADELRLEAAVTEHAGTVDTARRKLARARAERELIERHFERWRENRRKTAERRDD